MFYGVSSSVTECFQSVTDYLQLVTTGYTKTHGRRSSRDDTVTLLSYTVLMCECRPFIDFQRKEAGHSGQVRFFFFGWV